MHSCSSAQLVLTSLEMAGLAGCAVSVVAGWLGLKWLEAMRHDSKWRRLESVIINQPEKLLKSLGSLAAYRQLYRPGAISGFGG